MHTKKQLRRTLHESCPREESLAAVMHAETNNPQAKWKHRKAGWKAEPYSKATNERFSTDDAKWTRTTTGIPTLICNVFSKDQIVLLHGSCVNLLYGFTNLVSCKISISVARRQTILFLFPYHPWLRRGCMEMSCVDTRIPPKSALFWAECIPGFR